MAIDETTRVRVWTELRRLMDEHPDARIVTDVGASLFSGWGDLYNVIWHEKEHTIELIFD